ncbi:hypothetical protein [Frankia sp. Cr2]|uniref:hypothetical protein n=1 Tax=Frankia sp. Cr2 TaxID=3073932 RepID=UPI002AD3C10F|nr:hypothetical protein [Frankia sp. Cr2]
MLGFCVFVVMVIMVVGLVGLVRGHLHRLHVHNRRTAGFITGAGYLGILVLGVVGGTHGPAAVTSLAVSSSQSPSASPSAAPIPSPSPTTSPSATLGFPAGDAVAVGPVTPTTGEIPPAPQPAVAVATTSASAASAAGNAATAPTTHPVSRPSTQAAAQAPAAAPAPRPATTAAAAPAGNCDPAYPDVCLHDGIGDYDCAGGSGDGPNYVRGPLRVRSPDPFGLDHDHDGTGCENG